MISWLSTSDAREGFLQPGVAPIKSTKVDNAGNKKPQAEAMTIATYARNSSASNASEMLIKNVPNFSPHYPGTLCEGAHQLPSRQSCPGRVGRPLGAGQSAMSSNCHPLGHPALDHATATGRRPDQKPSEC